MTTKRTAIYAGFYAAALALTGCATAPTGITFHEGDAQRCAAMGCTVWTASELNVLANLARKQGSEQCGRGI